MKRKKVAESNIAAYLIENLRTFIIVLSNNNEKKSVHLRALDTFIMFQRSIAETVGQKCLKEYEESMERSYNAFVKSSIVSLESSSDSETNDAANEDTMQDRIICEYLAKRDEANAIRQKETKQ